jgi:Phycobilisome protein
MLSESSFHQSTLTTGSGVYPMNSVIERIVEEGQGVAGQGKYVDSEVLSALSTFADSMTARSSAYEAIQSKETTIIEKACQSIQGHAEPERLMQEMALLLRHSALAMLMDDATVLMEGGLSWVQAMAEAQQQKELYVAASEQLMAAALKALTDEQGSLLHPLLKLIPQTLKS